METAEIAAINIALHRLRTEKVLARTGGEIMHPDHYDFREAFRDAVLYAMDEASRAHGCALVTDADLPALFRSLDPLAERLWLKSFGIAK